MSVLIRWRSKNLFQAYQILVVLISAVVFEKLLQQQQQATPTYCKEIYRCRFPTVIPLESLQSIIKNLQIDTSPWLTFIWKMSFIFNISRFNSLMRYRDMDRNKSCLAQKKNYYRRKISPAQIFFSWLTAWLDEARWIVSFTLPGRDFWEGL